MLAVCSCDDVETEYLDMNRSCHHSLNSEPKEKETADLEVANDRYSV